MRTTLILLIFVMGMSAHAETLECRSSGPESIYYTEGTIRVKAIVIGDAALNRIEMDVTRGNLGFGPEDQITEGRETPNYVKFWLGADAWCNYRGTLPKNFRSRPKMFPMFMDAYCEENTNSSHRLICKLTK